MTAASLLANDSDVNGPSALTITAVGGAVNGTVLRNPATGDITFTPAPNFNGAASFTYTVSDGQATATGTVNVTVTPVNDAPVAVNDIASTQAPNSVIIAVLANDSDPDNLPPTAANAGLTVTNLTPVAGVGSLVLNANQTVTFTPAANFSGAASFTYRTLDSGGSLSNTATVTVNVAPTATGVDLDINRFTATAVQRVGRTVIFTARVINRSAINQPGSANLVGVQNGSTVYNQTRVASDPPGGGDTAVAFPNFVPTEIGRITWTLTVTDGNPDLDVATATTNVLQ